MIFKNLLNYIIQFFFSFKENIRAIYLSSNVYNKKISKVSKKNLEYNPSQILLDCLLKYEKKKIKIEDFSLNLIWNNKNLNEKDYKKLHSFFWLFSLDLKSSKIITQNVILNWINTNNKYEPGSWNIDILSKRVIAWVSNSKLTYEDGDETYKKKFNDIIKKQINHLINEIDKSEWVDDKMIGCSAIILAGLSYQDKSRYLSFGLNLLKKINKFSFDAYGFPKSRSIKQLYFYLKYFILIREWLKESQTDIPEYINESIYYLGQAYSLIWQKLKQNILFNGNQESNNIEFDKYLERLGYNFKNENNESGGYVILKNKKISIAMDVGQSPEKKFSKNYQSGTLSFEILSGDEKIICNSGYFENYKHQLNNVSKSTATHSTLIIDNSSSSRLKKQKNKESTIEQGLKIIKKSIIFQKNYWSINCAHDGYIKKYGVIHDRQIEFYPENNKFVGNDKLIKKKNFKSSVFEIRFHLKPNIKVMKTQDGKSILIEANKEGWKFTCDNHKVDIEKGLYFGKKNSYIENQNIFISGMTQNENQTIKWELVKIT